MTAEERPRLLAICKRSKRGRPLTTEERAFVKAAFVRDPNGYAEVTAEMHAWLRTASVWELL